MTRKSARRLGEDEAIRLLGERLGTRRRGVRLGIGDDAALLAGARGTLVWTVDACLEGAHFEREWLELDDVAWKALHAAVSDLAAMGAEPLGALSALELPPHFSKRDLEAFARGQALAARALGCPIVGGNLARGARLGVTTTVLGVAERPLRRDGARPGDEVWLVGAVGLAAAGLWLLRAGERARGRALERAVRAWKRPRALLREGRALVGRATSAIDISDGLGGDARHVAEASGVRIVLEEGALIRALPRDLEAAARMVGRSALGLGLAGGEDYALLATGPRPKRPRAARCIGRVSKGNGAFLERADGSLVALAPGYDHLGP
jgi:thiamine-monophosphate kinase